MRTMLLAASAALALSLPLSAQDEPKGAPAPSEIVAAAPKADWAAIPAEEVLVMTLAPDADGKPRTVVIQLMPAPFSQGWVHNIRLFARAKWYDGISVNRVQDNYVTQWGDLNYDNPEAKGQPKPLPEGLKVMTEADYVSTNIAATEAWMATLTPEQVSGLMKDPEASPVRLARKSLIGSLKADAYSQRSLFSFGWPLAQDGGQPESSLWPTHCYGMVGVGRNYSPDTGSGAELYTVIGHAPRHL
ncbi:MAG: peptidylprolyl isomerase, partial [Alphaproteobacteria bacterium PA3]